MKKLRQGFFYGFVFVVGFFFQPNWFYNNVYSYSLWADKAWVINRFLIYSLFSGVVTCALVWLFARFAKKYL